MLASAIRRVDPDVSSAAGSARVTPLAARPERTRAWSAAANVTVDIGAPPKTCRVSDPYRHLSQACPGGQPRNEIRLAPSLGERDVDQSVDRDIFAILTPIAGRLIVDAEASSADGIQVIALEPVGPRALVVFVREVRGTRTGDERLPDGRGVGLVTRAPRSGGDIHDVAPPLLVPHRSDGVD